MVNEEIKLNDWLSYDIRLFVSKKISGIFEAQYILPGEEHILATDEYGNLIEFNLEDVIPFLDFEKYDFIYQLICDNEVLTFKIRQELKYHVYKNIEHFENIKVYKIDTDSLFSKRLYFVDMGCDLELRGD